MSYGWVITIIDIHLLCTIPSLRLAGKQASSVIVNLATLLALDFS